MRGVLRRDTGGVTIADRFAAALAAQPAGPADPELLPVRLSRACVVVLGVDAAGLSTVDAAGRWLPLGASEPLACAAERMQFTAGEGPCTASREAGQPVLAVEEDLRRRWPAFAAQLLPGSPYRGVIALPLRPAPWGAGALDLYVTDAAAVAAVDVFAATAVGELVSAALSDATIWSTWTAEEGPDWLGGPASRQRARVWEAMGRISLDLDVPAEDALALLRADARTGGRSVDDVAAELLAGSRDPADLRTAR